MIVSEKESSGGFWQSKRAVLAISFAALLIAAYTTDAVGVPVHDYARGSIGGTPYQSIWYMNAFLIPAALTMPLVGNLKIRYGAKRLAIIGPGIFGLALFGESLATTSSILIFMRIMQGLGAGVIPATVGGYLGGGIGEKHIKLGKGILVIALAIGASSGISFGGLVTWYFNWRATFAVLGTLVLTAVSLIIKLMPDDRGNPEEKIDWQTFLLMAGGFGLLSISLTIGNQQEWFQSSIYVITLWTSIVFIGLFVWRMTTRPKLINPLIFKDVNYCISITNLTLILFFVFIIFGILPVFMLKVIGNTIGSYSLPFIPLILCSVLIVYITTPGISPCLIAKTTRQQKILASFGILGFAITTLWMAHTNMSQSNENITLQLALIGAFFGLIIIEVQMCFKTMPPNLMVSASSVLFFCTNIAKALSGGVSGAIVTASSQGSWDRFREQINSTNSSLEGYLAAIGDKSFGGITDNWSAASLELIHQVASKEVLVISYINLTTMTGVVLLFLSLLPLLHRDAKVVLK